MVPLHKKIMNVLEEEFPDVQDGLETVESTGRVTGCIISSAFTGQNDHSRQDRLWKVLASKLSEEEMSHIGPIVTLSPAEAEIDVSQDR